MTLIEDIHPCSEEAKGERATQRRSFSSTLLLTGVQTFNSSLLTTMAAHYLLLFAKYPYLSKVKTRLEPALGASKVQTFAQIALLETLQYFGRLSADSTCKCVWCFAPSAAADHVENFLRTNGLSDQWEAWPQDDGALDLGNRLSAAVQRATSTAKQERQNTDWQQTCTLIGSDCFHLTTSHIIAGIQSASQRTSMLLPATDGGYVQLSLPLPASASSFDNIQWSTSHTASDQIAQLHKIGHHVQVGEMLSDLDEPKDLQVLLLAAAEGQGSSHLQAVYPRTLAFVRQHVTAAVR